MLLLRQCLIVSKSFPLFLVARLILVLGLVFLFTISLSSIFALIPRGQLNSLSSALQYRHTSNVPHDPAIIISHIRTIFIHLAILRTVSHKAGHKETHHAVAVTLVRSYATFRDLLISPTCLC